MKKLYQTPIMKVVRLRTTKMIAASPALYMNKSEETEIMESRRGRGDFWDEDDEYDEYE